MAKILPFPQRNKGRIRKSTGAQSEGILAMVQFESYPDNVAHVHRHTFDEVSIIDLMAFGLDTLFRKLPIETRQAVKRSALIQAALAEDPRTQIVAAVFSSAFDKKPSRRS